MCLDNGLDISSNKLRFEASSAFKPAERLSQAFDLFRNKRTERMQSAG